MQDPEIDLDTETFETMFSGLVAHIHGPAEKDIVALLKRSKNLPQDVGAMTMSLVQVAAEQATQAGREFDIEMLLGVATEVIDTIYGIAESIGVIEDAQDEQMLGETLMAAVQLYAQTAEPGSDEQEAAQQALQQMMDDGTFDEARGTIAKMGAKQGVDPFADDDGVAGVDPRASGGQPAPQPARQMMAS